MFFLESIIITKDFIIERFSKLSVKDDFYNNCDLRPSHKEFSCANKINLRNPKLASVIAIILFKKNNNPKIILIQRSDYKGEHSGQISFPGGKKEVRESLKEAGKREVFEEIGISDDSYDVIAKLSDIYIPPSNFMVTPFVAISDFEIVYDINYEVKNIIELDLSKLLDDENMKISTVIVKNKSYDVPSFCIDGNVIWGATACILNKIKTTLS